MISAALQQDVGWLRPGREDRRIHHSPGTMTDSAHPRPESKGQGHLSSHTVLPIREACSCSLG